MEKNELIIQLFNLLRLYLITSASFFLIDNIKGFLYCFYEVYLLKKTRSGSYYKECVRANYKNNVDLLIYI